MNHNAPEGPADAAGAAPPGAPPKPGCRYRGVAELAVAGAAGAAAADGGAMDAAAAEVPMATQNTKTTITTSHSNMNKDGQGGVPSGLSVPILHTTRGLQPTMNKLQREKQHSGTVRGGRQPRTLGRRRLGCRGPRTTSTSAGSGLLLRPLLLNSRLNAVLDAHHRHTYTTQRTTIRKQAEGRG